MPKTQLTPRGTPGRRYGSFAGKAAATGHKHGVGTLVNSAPAFTGSATSVVQPYLVVHFWKRTA